MSKTYNKLVRDKIPDIIRGNREEPVIRILDDGEYKVELERKLKEEVEEVLNAKESKDKIEELADVLEVLSSLASLENNTLEEVIKIMKEKRDKRGGFEEKIFLEEVI